MKIACIGYLHGAGGAERQIIMLANAMAERGHEVHLLILAANKSQYDVSKDVQIHDLTVVEEYTGNKIINRYKALKRALAEIKPDISVSYWLQSAYYCAMMPNAITGKNIYSERGDPGDKEYSGLLGIVRGLAFKRVDGFVFQSEGARDYFKGSVKKKSVVIHNSVSIPEDKYLKPCEKREKKIITVGRLHPQKNQKLLIDAFARVADTIPEYSLDIYGDGELKAELQKQIDDLGLTERIFLKGTRKNVLDYVYTASLFVLSSDYEGMPNALMEAMAIGVPCISTDCRPGGARTLICDKVNGWITPIGDVNELSSRMRDVLLKHEKNDEIILNAMKLRKSHSKKSIFDDWEKFFKSFAETR